MCAYFSILCMKLSLLLRVVTYNDSRARPPSNNSTSSPSAVMGLSRCSKTLSCLSTGMPCGWIKCSESWSEVVRFLFCLSVLHVMHTHIHICVYKPCKGRFPVLTLRGLFPSYEGGHFDSGVVPALRGPSWDETQVHMEHLPVHWIRRGAGPAAGNSKKKSA